ncbi:MAG: FG-GAP-like repeat-containing protein [Acidobacteriota bacterium]|nr:FG-GAP-like repeat-containing protein [Acidobacteriota bacterium]
MQAKVGRRKKRLRRVVWLIVAASVTAVVAGLGIWLSTRPETRTPGEDLPEITARLALDLPADAPLPHFADVTSAAGLGDFRAFTGERTSQLPEDMGAGAAWGDFDNDGDDDLFLVSAGGSLELTEQEIAQSKLFENLGDGTFREFGGFPETRIHGMGAAWGDFDSDGRLDLVVSGYRALLLFHNNGDRFVLDPSLAAPDGYWAGVAWSDFDNDLDLDLYVCGYVDYKVDDASRRRFSDQYGQAVPYTLNPASFEPSPNLLFRNRLSESGQPDFVEEAVALGVSNPGGRSLTALWHDFDSDGRQDLYVANDISDNALFLNLPAGFEDSGLAAWVADYRGAMGLTAGDWNRDGDDDLFVTHWVAQENALYDARRLSATETSTGALVFSDLAAPLGLGQIALQSVGWGTEFADFDSDGWLDVFIANGSTFETTESPKRLKPQKPFLMWNRQGRTFHDIAPLAESLSEPWVGRGLATSDYDQDGDLDVLVMDLERGPRLLRNNLEDMGNWLEIRLRRLSEADGFPGAIEGATVTAWLGDVPLRRSLTRASYLSQSSHTLHFGLGAAANVDRIEVAWPGGETESYSGVSSNAIWQITEGETEPRRISGVGAVSHSASAPPAGDRERLIEFWSKQRAAMDAMKRDGDTERALTLFQEALALNPEHGDSRYYLANLLADKGQTKQALAELDVLTRQNPLSHRGYRQRGILLALSAQSDRDLAAAETALERALEINREETGALLALGEVALLRGNPRLADERLALVLQSNPRAVGALFLRGYVAWLQGDETAAGRFLEQARTALGPEWKPEGTTAEGDVAVRSHQETSPLSRFWEEWDGQAEAATAFAPLRSFLR